MFECFLLVGIAWIMCCGLAADQAGGFPEDRGMLRAPARTMDIDRMWQMEVGCKAATQIFTKSFVTCVTPLKVVLLPAASDKA
jgi:hypothetical protein